MLQRSLHQSSQQICLQGLKGEGRGWAALPDRSPEGTRTQAEVAGREYGKELATAQREGAGEIIVYNACPQCQVSCVYTHPYTIGSHTR